VSIRVFSKYNAIDLPSDDESDDDLPTLAQLARRPLDRENSRAGSSHLKRKPQLDKSVPDASGMPIGEAQQKLGAGCRGDDPGILSPSFAINLKVLMIRSHAFEH
jgi:hypothetical protein